jgi:glutathione S-transferase
LLLYEQQTKDQGIVDPYTWQTRLVLYYMQIKVKKLSYSLWEFNTRFNQEGIKNLPALIDGPRVIEGPWEIANYLERNFPDSPSLFRGELGTHFAHFFSLWVEEHLLGHLYCLVGKNLYEALADQDKPLFKNYLQRKFNLSGNFFSSGKKKHLDQLNSSLGSVRSILQEEPYLSGQGLGYVDIILYSVIRWAEDYGMDEIFEQTDVIYIWKTKMDTWFSDILGKDCHFFL